MGAIQHFCLFVGQQVRILVFVHIGWDQSDGLVSFGCEVLTRKLSSVEEFVKGRLLRHTVHS